jgi:hypothetical protein
VVSDLLERRGFAESRKVVAGYAAPNNLKNTALTHNTVMRSVHSLTS